MEREVTIARSRTGPRWAAALLLALLPATAGGETGSISIKPADQSKPQAWKSLSGASFNVPPPDRSLDVKDYLPKGMPASDRPWTPADYAQAGQVLQQISSSTPLALPRWKSKRSGALFERIIAAENLEALRDPNIPLPQRVMSCADFATKSAALPMAYIQASRDGAVFDSELVEIMHFQMQLLDIALANMEAFLPTLDPADPSYPTRMAGAAKARRGLAMAVNGYLRTIEEKKAFRAGVRLRLAGYLNENLPHLAKYLPEYTAAELAGRVRSMRDREEEETVKTALTDLLAKIDTEQ